VPGATRVCAPDCAQRSVVWSDPGNHHGWGFPGGLILSLNPCFHIGSYALKPRDSSGGEKADSKAWQLAFYRYGQNMVTKIGIELGGVGMTRSIVFPFVKVTYMAFLTGSQ
jgi:hypothetical protein